MILNFKIVKWCMLCATSITLKLIYMYFKKILIPIKLVHKELVFGSHMCHWKIILMKITSLSPTCSSSSSPILIGLSTLNSQDST